ncbi:type II toxin-antitoxin system RelE/ParE family toxin [Granulicella aggregans]|uniref:type II toxin-antitoxin system RelE/ParE family toxin n=1 Tax=Granulicella aggregans TaxID=474949 RepID=UPI0037BE65DE
MQIRWLPSAAEDLEGIHEYLSSNHPNYAARTIRAIYEAVQGLRRFPYRGRPTSEPGVRVMQLPRSPYLIFYRLHEGAIEVLYIRHGAQDNPL